MIKLTVNNSFSRIEGLTDDQFKALREKLSYRVDAQESYFGGLSRSPKRYLITKRGDFPTGLLSYVNEWVSANSRWSGSSVEYRRTIPFSKEKLFDMDLGDKTPRPSQVVAALEAVKTHRGVVRMPTRAGKSLVMAMIINALQLRTLIVVPSVGLRDQLRKDLQDWFGVTPGNIAVHNIDSGYLSELKDFDVLILDEAHHAAAKTYRELNKKAWTDIYYRFFFTATPFRSNSEEQLLMESVTGQVIYNMTYQDALKEGCVVPIEAYYVDVPEVEIDSNNWRKVYNEGIVHHDARNDLIKHLMVSLAASGSVLCLLREIAHGRQIEAATGFPFANGQDGLVRMRVLEFNLKETLGLIGTVGVLGEGMTLPHCEYVLIAGGGKSRIQFMQNVGRGVAAIPGKESCKVILFRDTSHKFLRRHFNAQIKTLREEYGVKPVKLEVAFNG